MVFLLSNICSTRINVGPTGRKEVLVFSSVKLPCDADLDKDNDTVQFVFWYKDDESTPIYTVDARTAESVKAGLHTSRLKHARFNVDAKPSYLEIDDLQEEDGGSYFCRVDYSSSYSLVEATEVSVVVPPKEVVIRDSNGMVIRDTIGPFKEGDSLNLSCVAVGGYPDINVTWWRGDELYDDSFEFVDGGTVNTVTIKNLQRSDLENGIRCEARNSMISPPYVKPLHVDIHLSLLKIHMTEPPLSMPVGRWGEFLCTAHGSQPPAKITWWMNNTKVNPEGDQQHESNHTSSTLRIRLEPSHHGSILTCRGENSRFNPPSILETSRVLNVTYAPLVNLSLELEDMEREEIKENDFVRLCCSVEANPSNFQIFWLLNGEPMNLQHTTADISQDHQITFRKISRNDKGYYQCFAANSEGRTVSKILYIDVLHAPVCKPGQKMTYHVALGNPVIIRCEVEANPANLTFRWEVSPTVSDDFGLSHRTEGFVDFATYVPITMDGYGTIFCTAYNSVGNQKTSCFFNILPPLNQTENDTVKHDNSTSNPCDPEVIGDGPIPEMCNVNSTSPTSTSAVEEEKGYDTMTIAIYSGIAFSALLILLVIAFIVKRLSRRRSEERAGEAAAEELEMYNRVYCYPPPRDFVDDYVHCRQSRGVVVESSP